MVAPSRSYSILDASLEARPSNQHSPFNVLHIDGGLFIRPSEGPNRPALVRALTPREVEILALVAEGFANKTVADHLNISERTVKNHLNDIFTKLNASDRTHAVVTAVRLGILAI